MALRAVLGVVAVLGLMVAAVAPASADDDDGPDGGGGVVLKVEPGVDPEALAQNHRLTVTAPLVASRGIYLLAADPEADGKPLEAKDLVQRLAKEDGVVYAEAARSSSSPEDDRFHAWPEGAPADAGADPEAWRRQEAAAALRLDDVHRIATGVGVVVAVLDTGADLDHHSLVGAIVDGGYDYIDDDSVPEEEANGRDDDGDGSVDESWGHGTHTAGLVALVAPDAAILVYRVLDSDGNGNEYVVAEAINDAIAAGADVINVSFGMREKTESKVLREAFENAARADVVIVAAAGNDGEKYSQYPAETEGVIGVGAMDRENDELADFSNHGKATMVAAPGEDVVSTVPGGGFASWSGTSMASPIVAGQAALVRSHDPDLRMKHVIATIGRSSHKLSGKRKVQRGIIDIHRSLAELDGADYPDDG